MRRIPNRAAELEIRTAEEFWGSWVDEPVDECRSSDIVWKQKLIDDQIIPND